jgi:hypothetical protein
LPPGANLERAETLSKQRHGVKDFIPERLSRFFARAITIVRRTLAGHPADPHPPADRDIPLDADRVARRAQQNHAAIRQRDPIQLDKTGEAATQLGHRVPLIRVRTSGREEKGNGVATGPGPKLSGANMERA